MFTSYNINVTSLFFTSYSVSQSADITISLLFTLTLENQQSKISNKIHKPETSSISSLLVMTLLSAADTAAAAACGACFDENNFLISITL